MWERSPRRGHAAPGGLGASVGGIHVADNDVLLYLRQLPWQLPVRAVVRPH